MTRSDFKLHIKKKKNDSILNISKTTVRILRIKYLTKTPFYVKWKILQVRMCFFFHLKTGIDHIV